MHKVQHIVYTIRKHNLLSPINGLWEISRQLSGQKLFLCSKGFTHEDPKYSLWNNNAFFLQDFARTLFASGKFPYAVLLSFPKDQKRIRDFFRDIIRTKIPFNKAACRNWIGIKIVFKSAEELMKGLAVLPFINLHAISARSIEDHFRNLLIENKRLPPAESAFGEARILPFVQQADKKKK